VKNFDWVTALSDCSIGEVFLRLKQQVEEDVKTRHGQLPRESDYGFRFMADGDKFSAIVEGDQILKQVVFRRSGKAISVQGEGVNFDATLTLSDAGECRVKISGQEYELWQMRKKALEKLLFDDYRT
jgi:hypothetical protein